MLFGFFVKVCIAMAGNSVCIDTTSPFMFDSVERCRIVAAVQAGMMHSAHMYLPAKVYFRCEKGEPYERTSRGDGATAGVLGAD